MERIALFEKVSEAQYNKDASAHLNDGDYSCIKLPVRATKGSAGYDFFLPMDLDLKAGESVVVATGIRVKIRDGWFLATFPKSGLGFKYRLRLDNTVGIIDSDYYYSGNEGHILTKLTNCGSCDIHLPKGKSFTQGIFIPFGITFDDDAQGIRDGGFGSTDLKK